jgi:hypothetical protein
MARADLTGDVVRRLEFAQPLARLFVFQPARFGASAASFVARGVFQGNWERLLDFDTLRALRLRNDEH